MSHSSTITDELSTPGEILLEEFLEPLGITAYRLARVTGMPQPRVSEIIRGKRAVTADTALRLAGALGTTPQFWLNLQGQHDLAAARRSRSSEYDGITALV